MARRHPLTGVAAAAGRRASRLSPAAMHVLAAGVGEISRFPGVDDLLTRFDALVEQYPGLAASRRVGTSRLGEPIPAITVGTGPMQHLIVGGVHPNEPVGGLSAFHLARLLCENAELRDDLDASWTFVPCIDPDGMRLNEGWFADPADRTGYFASFYRPAPDEQVEWTFPFAYKNCYFDAVLPETAAFMRLIDTLAPDLLVSLHNSELGGAYFYLSRPAGDLADRLRAVAGQVGLALHVGEPEAPWLAEIAPAVFNETTSQDAYEYLESIGEDPRTHIAGASSADYTRRYGTLCMVAEAPQWTHPDADDETPSGRAYVDVLRATGDELTALGEIIVPALHRAEPLLRMDTPYLRASRKFVPMMAQEGAMWLQRAQVQDPDRIATVAEVFSCAETVRMFRLRFGGMLVRALAVEVDAGIAPVDLRRLRGELAAHYAGWEDEARTAVAVPVPLHRLAGLQVGSILHSAAVLALGESPTDTAERVD